MSIPKVGEKAPPFELRDEYGELVSLSDFQGTPIVLYFYPKDDTPGCTKEACSFRDDYSVYKEAGYRVIGVSPDSSASHERFKAKHDLQFSLLADEEHKAIEAYGVWGTKKFRGREYKGVNRTTFVIDGDGKIANVFENVKPADHSQELLAALGIREG